uniref:U6 small nuclear RNA (adenine-(43)-N(6))-methyltransferase n=1 Tax=Salmo trutta TaxID=8032 RepID=A0A674DYW7_SALTR
MAGKAMLNFKEPEAVRALTCTLLKEDFGLTTDIPLERLIPTVSLRLNYIHWVEDLIGGQGEPRRGIDIGTGASCIYPLLGASMNGWHYLATEVDDICLDYATRNVEQNNLSDLIKVVKVPQKTLLMDALEEESAIVYDFCMCNPPSFANQLEAKVGVNSRNSRRPPPSSVNTGGVTEIMGGELEFVKRIIHDSLQLKTRLRCMLGKKCSLVPKVSHTDFCQGRTMRWYLGKSHILCQWIFNYFHLPHLSPPSKKRKLEKSRNPLSFMLLQSQASSIGCPSNPWPVEAITAWLEKTLSDLKVNTHRQSLFLTALPRAPPSGTSTTLSSATAQHPQSQQHSTPHTPYSSHSDLHTPTAAQGPGSVPQSGTNRADGANSQGVSCVPDENSGTEDDVIMESSTSTTPNITLAQTALPTTTQKQETTPHKVPTETDLRNPSVVQHFLFKCLVNVKAEEQDIAVEIRWVEGTLFKVVAKPLGI